MKKRSSYYHFHIFREISWYHGFFSQTPAKAQIAQYAPGDTSLKFVVEWLWNWVVYFSEVEKKALPDSSTDTKIANYHQDEPAKVPK